MVRVFHKGLLQQSAFGVELFQLPVDDLVPDLFRLAGFAHLLPVHTTLPLHHVRRDLLARYAGGIGSGDVQGDQTREFLELLGFRDKVGFTIELHQHTNLAAHMNVARDGALPRLALCPLCRFGRAAGAENVDCVLHVAVRLRQGGFALHHPRAGAVAEFLHVFG